MELTCSIIQYHLSSWEHTKRNHRSLSALESNQLFVTTWPVISPILSQLEKLMNRPMIKQPRNLSSRELIYQRWQTYVQRRQQSFNVHHKANVYGKLLVSTRKMLQLHQLIPVQAILLRLIVLMIQRVLGNLILAQRAQGEDFCLHLARSFQDGMSLKQTEISWQLQMPSEKTQLASFQSLKQCFQSLTVISMTAFLWQTKELLQFKKLSISSIMPHQSLKTWLGTNILASQQKTIPALKEQQKKPVMILPMVRQCRRELRSMDSSLLPWLKTSLTVQLEAKISSFNLWLMMELLAEDTEPTSSTLISKCLALTQVPMESTTQWLPLLMLEDWHPMVCMISLQTKSLNAPTLLRQHAVTTTTASGMDQTVPRTHAKNNWVTYHVTRRPSASGCHQIPSVFLISVLNTLKQHRVLMMSSACGHPLIPLAQLMLARSTVIQPLVGRRVNASGMEPTASKTHVLLRRLIKHVLQRPSVNGNRARVSARQMHALPMALIHLARLMSSAFGIIISMSAKLIHAQVTVIQTLVGTRALVSGIVPTVSRTPVRAIYLMISVAAKPNAIGISHARQTLVLTTGLSLLAPLMLSAYGQIVLAHSMLAQPMLT